jgi:hypothetical protein
MSVYITMFQRFHVITFTSNSRKRQVLCACEWVHAWFMYLFQRFPCVVIWSKYMKNSFKWTLTEILWILHGYRLWLCVYACRTSWRFSASLFMIVNVGFYMDLYVIQWKHFSWSNCFFYISSDYYPFKVEYLQIFWLRHMGCKWLDMLLSVIVFLGLSFSWALNHKVDAFVWYIFQFSDFLWDFTPGKQI